MPSFVRAINLYLYTFYYLYTKFSFMAELLKDYSLKDYNTFGIDVKCNYFFRFENEEELLELIGENQLIGSNVLVLGGGSNLLFVEDYKGLVIYPENKGIDIVDEDEDNVVLRVGAGVDWDEFVEYTVNNNWSGLENLSLIPGNVGASPVQNIGAYGVEVGDSIYSVEAVNIESGEKVEILNEECEFGYRHSIFKTEFKEMFVVTYVNFILNKQFEPKLEYGSIKSETDKLGGPSLGNVRKAVITIRESKLPDPDMVGNAGSFFKNPVVDEGIANMLREKYEGMPEYPASGGVKLAAGWLIDKCGWKGYRKGDAGVHKDQALVLVNYGNATGLDIISLANEIKKSVFMEFGVNLEMEVRIV